MKKTMIMSLIAASMLLAGPTLRAQTARISLDFPGLAEKASETVEVTLDGQMLQFASKFLSKEDADADVRDLIRNLKGIYVKSYTFDDEGEYDPRSVDHVRSQLGAGWQRIVNVKSSPASGGENVEVYLLGQGDKLQGMTIISAEPKELTIVNIVGPIDIEKLSSLEGKFGIPKGVTGGKKAGQ